jgi:hypothetical protein
LSHGADNLLEFLVSLVNKFVNVLLQLPKLEAIQLLLCCFDLLIKAEVLLFGINN